MVVLLGGVNTSFLPSFVVIGNDNYRRVSQFDTPLFINYNDNGLYSRINLDLTKHDVRLNIDVYYYVAVGSFY